MPTQKIGTIKVVVNNQGLGPLTVKQGTQTESTVRAIQYGQQMQLKSAVDLDRSGAETGEAIIYNGSTDTFEVGPVTANNSIFANTANTVLLVQGGTF